MSVTDDDLQAIKDYGLVEQDGTSRRWNLVVRGVMYVYLAAPGGVSGWEPRNATEWNLWQPGLSDATHDIYGTSAREVLTRAALEGWLWP